MVALLVIAIIVGVMVYFSQKAAKGSERESQIANEAINHHLAAYLRERTGRGPWLEMNDFYRKNIVDLKCTSCPKDTIFVCNQNPTKESEFADVHFKGGRLRVLSGNRVLFEGDPINLMSYPDEEFIVRHDNPPPKETDAYGLWEQHFGAAESQE
jgi:hypothetical protein